MNVAFFGASSQIAKGLIKKFSRSKANKLYFFVRNKESFAIWLVEKKLSFEQQQIKTYDELSGALNIDLFIFVFQKKYIYIYKNKESEGEKVW